MLTIVDLALRQCPTLANLEHTTRIISNFLGPPPNLQLSEACEVGRVDLLDWIWSVCPTNPDDRTPGWSLTDYLRSDPHYHRWQFSKSLYVAAKRGDLEVVKWLFQHFAACEAPSDVVCAAAEGGRLHILRYLWDHRSRPEESDFHSGTAVGQDDDVANHANVRCTVKFDERCHAGNWGKTAIQKAFENGQLAECLTLGLILGKKDRQIAKSHAVQIGQTEFAEKLLHVRINVLHYASECSRPQISHKVLESGHLQWHEDFASSTLRQAAQRGNVELLRDIFQLHSPVRENHSLWKRSFQAALQEASAAGNWEVVGWLLQHSVLSELLDDMKKNNWHHIRCTLFEAAVKQGHVEAMQHLFEMGIVCCIFNTITCTAVRENQVDSVKWLAEHVWMDTPEQFEYATAKAAELGRVEVLQVLFSLNPPKRDCKVRKKSGRKIRTQATKSSFKWSPQLMYKAAVCGHVNVLNWLQDNRFKESGTDAMDIAATNGHLDTVKWLHSNRLEICTTKAMHGAAENGHFEMVKWLYENRPQSRSHVALLQAMRFGHLRSAYWLRGKYFDCSVSWYSRQLEKRLLNASWQQNNVLEAFLFLRELYPNVLTSYYIRSIYKSGNYRQPSHNAELVVEWIRGELSRRDKWLA